MNTELSMTSSRSFFKKAVSGFNFQLMQFQPHTQILSLGQGNCSCCNRERDILKVVKKDTFTVCSFCGSIIKRN